MNVHQPSDVPPRRAVDLCAVIPLGSRARALLTAEQSVEEFLACLLEKGHYPEALRLTAVSLPPRDAVWWACLCVRHAVAEALPAAERAALGAAVGWVLQPGGETAAAAGQAARALPAPTAAGQAAEAASLADGKSPLRANKLAGAAVFLAAARVKSSARVYREFLALGRDVAQTASHWLESAPRR